MSFYKGRDSDDDDDDDSSIQMLSTPPPPGTGQLKRGGTTCEPQPTQLTRSTSSGAAGASGFGPCRRVSGSHNRSSTLMDQHQPLLPPQDEWHFSLPDSWSCEEKNSAGIVSGESSCELFEPSERADRWSIRSRYLSDITHSMSICGT